jgi:hypothetical protein
MTPNKNDHSPADLIHPEASLGKWRRIAVVATYGNTLHTRFSARAGQEPK